MRRNCARERGTKPWCLGHAGCVVSCFPCSCLCRSCATALTICKWALAQVGIAGASWGRAGGDGAALGSTCNPHATHNKACPGLYTSLCCVPAHGHAFSVWPLSPVLWCCGVVVLWGAPHDTRSVHPRSVGCTMRVVQWTAVGEEALMRAPGSAGPTHMGMSHNRVSMPKTSNAKTWAHPAAAAGSAGRGW